MSPLDAKRPLVRLDCVTRRFGDLVAVDNVSFDIAENEFFALLGPSGCGKTTVLRILAGLDEPDDGTITLDGEDLMAMPVHRRPVNLMFQSYALFPHLTVAKNVAYGLERERRPRPEIRQRVADVLDVVGLGAVATRKPAQLSGGQRQRVALARAIVKRPKLLLLDEPLAALDRKIRGQMQTELKRLQHDVGITFVVVTHDQDEAMSMADRIAVMNAGRIEQLASPTVLYERPVSRFVADFIGSTNLLDGVVTSGGILLASGTCVAADVAGRNAGSPVAASLRPELIRFDAATVESGVTSVAGTIGDVQFFGGTSHVLVEVAGFGRPIVATSVGPTPRRPGDDVTLSWSAKDLVVVDGTISGPADTSPDSPREQGAS
ncbi:MAG TPA: ABC transporter ATP-binding protein [Desertimonas sp.]|nr:ABC transporter ATP-binding protein [Desertimonas sp.]